MAAQAVAALGGLITGDIAARKELEANNQVAQTVFADSQRAADRKREDTVELRDEQSLAFLKSGVELEGSPLLVLQDTIDKGFEDAREISRQGLSEAESIMRTGRARFGAQTQQNFNNLASNVGRMGSQYNRKKERGSK